MNKSLQYVLAYLWIIAIVGAALLYFFWPGNVANQNGVEPGARGDCALTYSAYCNELAQKHPRQEFTQKKLDEALDKHRAWLRDVDAKKPDTPKDPPDDLSNGNLQGLDFKKYKDLRWAKLALASLGPQKTDLTGVNLGGAAMACSDLRNAVLENAKLNLAADLTSALMCGADLKC